MLFIYAATRKHEVINNPIRPSGDSLSPAANAAVAELPELSDLAIASVTDLIGEVQRGDASAWHRIYSALYDELHQIARAQIRQHRRGPDSSPTSLISRTWLRLSQASLTLEDRNHLLGVLAQAMRYALLDETRRLLTEKRGVGLEAVTLDPTDPALASDHNLEDLLAIDAALRELAAIDPRLGLLVELRYFGGMTEEETAQVLGVSDRTVRRDWRRARAFLSSNLGGDVADTSPN